jgi:hypothetical protein
MPESTSAQFLQMVHAEAQLAGTTSSVLNIVAIIVAIAIAATTFAATLAVAAELWTKTVRAILAGLPGFFAAVLAVLNPRIDWHRKKEIELNAIVLAVQYQSQSLAEASEHYADVLRTMEGQWQKAKTAEEEPAVTAPAPQGSAERSSADAR